MLFGLLIATAGNSLMAQEVNIDVAQNRALDFLSKQIVGTKHAKGASDALMPTLAYTSKSEGRTCFYVFNAGDDAGFVIVGGDEAAREILGYCDHGTFNYDTAPENLKWWLSQYTEQIAHADAQVANQPRRAKAANTRVGIEPMIRTKWNQSDPYNNLIPTYEGNTFVTGCVATAVAQVMYLYKYPTRGTGSHSYTLNEYPGVTFAADFANTTYDWDDMLLSYLNNYTTVQAQAVATLMYHIGVSVDMQYDISTNGGSGAHSEDIGYALATHFGYDKAVRIDLRNYFSDDDWESLVYDELTAGRPVLYSGTSASGGGHQFICDGYDSEHDMFTFNWGWGGNCDGCYLLTGTGALQPNGNGIGGAGSGSAYVNNQMIVTGVRPENGGKEQVHVVQRDKESNTMYLKVGDIVYSNYEYDRSTGARVCSLYSTLWNLSCLTNQFDFGVKAVEMTTGTTYYSTSLTNRQLHRRSAYTNEQQLNFNPYYWDEGTYELRPVCRKAGSTDDDWFEVDKILGLSYPTIKVTGEQMPIANTVHFTSEPFFNNDNNTYIDDVVMHFSLKNGTDAMANAIIYYKLSTGYYTFSGRYGFTNVASDAEVSGDLDLHNIVDYLIEGNAYTVELYTNEEHTSPYNYPSVTFTYRPKLTLEYRVSPAGYGTIILPFNSELPDGMTVYSCMSVNDNGVLVLTEESSIRRNTPYVVLGDDETQYTFEGPEAVDATHPSFQTGVLVGAFTDDVPLVVNQDYILQYDEDSNKAAFYLYNIDEDRMAAPYRAFLRIDEANAEYAPPILPGNETDGIEMILPDIIRSAGIYTIDGRRHSLLQKGLNVIVLEDGTARKVLVK